MYVVKVKASCYGLAAFTVGAEPCKPHSKSSKLCDIQQGGFLIIRNNAKM